jgi:hypothetical protein
LQGLQSARRFSPVALTEISFPPPASRRRVVTKIVLLLSIGEKTQDLKRDTRTRSKTKPKVTGYLDATTVPIRRRGVRLIPLRRLGDSVRRRRLDAQQSRRAIRLCGVRVTSPPTLWTTSFKANHRVAIGHTHFDVQGVGLSLTPNRARHPFGQSAQ